MRWARVKKTIHRKQTHIKVAVASKNSLNFMFNAEMNLERYKNKLSDIYHKPHELHDKLNIFVHNTYVLPYTNTLKRRAKLIKLTLIKVHQIFILATQLLLNDDSFLP